MIEHDIEQGTAEWSKLRRGKLTASRMGKLVTPKTMKPSAQMADLACELIADTYMFGAEAWVRTDYQSAAMDYGLRMESEARAWFEMETGLEVRQVGFCESDDGRMGASPDGLIDPDSGLELKCPELKGHIRYLIDGTMPAEYRGQVHGSMIVTGRSSWHFMSYGGPVRPLLIEVKRDEYTEALESAMQSFWKMYDKMLEQVRGPEHEVTSQLMAAGYELSAGAVSPF